MNDSLTYDIATVFLKTQFGGSKKTKKWTTLVHNGVLFPDQYIPHKIPIVYKNDDGTMKEIVLPEEAEEYVTSYCKYLNSEYAEKKIFHQNFFKSLKPFIKGLGITKLESCDFSKIVKYVLDIKEKRLLMTPEEKQLIKDKEALIAEKYKVAIVDGKEQPIGNYKMEPAGIFLGRGNHPKLGMIKTRVTPLDVTINISKGITLPVKYKKIIHDNKAIWLASWKDNISGKTKYMWLGNKSDFKAQSDQEKFDLARKLKKNISKIRKQNLEILSHSDKKFKQLATALYFIDNFALRVGNEKNDDEADTVGVTSLRIEHVELKTNYEIKLDFLGKDSVRYVNTVKVIPEVYKNLEEFMNNKEKSEDVFDLINPNELNIYIKEFMPNLTTKVFRTFNASHLFQEELNIISEKFKNYDKPDKIHLLISNFNIANAKVAKLCNHQKNVNKNYSEDIKKIKDTLSELKTMLKDDSVSEKKKEKIREKIKKTKLKKDVKEELKNISLGTSKTNYIDPRISVAFLKKHNIPIESVFSKTLREKFFWAFDIDENWEF